MAWTGSGRSLDLAFLGYGLAKVTIDHFAKWSWGFSFGIFFFLLGAPLTHYLLKRTFIAPRETPKRFMRHMTAYLWSADHWRSFLLVSAVLLFVGAVVITFGKQAGVPILLAGWLLLSWTLTSLAIQHSWTRFGDKYQAALAQAPVVQRRGRRTMYATLARIAIVVAIIEEAAFLVAWFLATDPLPFLGLLLLLPVFQATVAWLVLRYLKRA